MIVQTLISVAAIAGVAGFFVWELRHPDRLKDDEGEGIGAELRAAKAAEFPDPANANLPQLTADHMRVLADMSAHTGYPASVIASHTGVSVARVSVIRRQLRDMGLATYGPLINEDTGAPNGSGYLLTKAGVAAQFDMRNVKVAA